MYHAERFRQRRSARCTIGVILDVELNRFAVVL